MDRGIGDGRVAVLPGVQPTTQGEKFDPDGEYVRRWVPELRGIAGKAVHALKDGRPEDYPPPIVDHAHERQEALARYGEIKAL